MNYIQTDFDNSSTFDGHICRECGTFIIEPIITTTISVDKGENKYQKQIEEVFIMTDRIEDALDDLRDTIYTLEKQINESYNRR